MQMDRWLTTLTCTLALAGCPAGGDDDDGDDDTVALDDDDSAASVVAILDTYPLDGDEDVYLRDDLVVWFTDVVSGAELSLADEATGDELPGDTTVAETILMGGHSPLTRLMFDPYGSDPGSHMIPDTAYIATIAWPGHEPQTVSFRTSTTGPPVSDPQNEVEGRDYLWDIYSAYFLEPFEGCMVEPLFGLASPGIHVAELDEANGQLRVFAAYLDWEGGHYVQDLCQPTISLHDTEDSLWSNPYFELGPLSVAVGDPFETYGLFDEMQVTGSFEPDGSAYTGGTLDGILNTLPLDSYVGDGTHGSACAAFEALGISCEPCPDGSGSTCLAVAAFGLQGARVDVWGTHPETGDAVSGITEVTDDMVAAWMDGGFCP